MKCIYCKEEHESDDNFCPSCGHWTVKGYSLLKKGKIKKSINTRKGNHLLTLGYLFVILIIVSILGIYVISKKNKNTSNN